MTGLVRYEVSDQVATVTLDSPHNRNALSRQLVTELSARLAEAGGDQAVRAVVLSHTGRVFCAGADLTEAAGLPMTGATAAIVALITAIVELPKPVIVRVTGHVRAGGMGLVGACDLAVATETASFAFTEARIGLTPAIISLTTLDLMTPRAAARYYLTGETFGAEAAASAGLITVATSNADLGQVLGGLLTQVRETSPQGAAQTKQLLTSGRRQRLAERSEAMAELSARLFATEEAQEGIHAFLERRPPAWLQS
ncbi:MAG TPA: enoyl-CoA hydratase family protein [Streptosporangiaceae bacterium]|nr:enoyl-CoA hydratase family protein [Streptosporangiaceae bacterium]